MLYVQMTLTIYALAQNEFQDLGLHCFARTHDFMFSIISVDSLYLVVGKFLR